MWPKIGTRQAIEGTAWVTPFQLHSGHAAHPGRAAGPVLGSSCMLILHADPPLMPARSGARKRKASAPLHITSVTTARIDAPAQLDSDYPPSSCGDGYTIAAIVTGDPGPIFPSQTHIACEGLESNLLCRDAGGCLHRAAVWPGRNSDSAAPVQAQWRAEGRLGPCFAQGVPWPPHRCQQPQH